VPYRIPTGRLLLLTVLSYGIFLYYWFYLTWRQYRDHTGKRAFPVWHTLALGVPIYGLYRTHAHMDSYNRLMHQAGQPTSINAPLTVALMLISVVLSIVSFLASGALPGIEFPGVQGVLMKLGFDVLAIATATVLLIHVQPKLNSYWIGLPEVQTSNTRLGSGEITSLVIGILAWTSAVISLAAAG